ncbi:MAG: Peptide methionine sulfoxide reductase MsrA [Parcubacteria group bacterium GW2011_GWA2_51_10]|nr:MAG: Peptide methionine sulfoxide reductase MsrA [Parcubacteria group bacterium GW2011_GWA2_51_10]
MKTSVFGGGCFWCTEAVFRMLKGISNVEPGYAGGSTENPTYENVSSGATGHAEVIHVTYDESQISYDDLLTVYFASHDPTTPNRQGNDVGTQYRSIILYETEEERIAAERMIADLQKELKGERIVTEVKKLEKFYPAEDYHKKYFENNKSAAYCQIVIEPKIEKIKKRFTKLLNEHGTQ